MPAIFGALANWSHGGKHVTQSISYWVHTGYHKPNKVLYTVLSCNCMMFRTSLSFFIGLSFSKLLPPVVDQYIATVLDCSCSLNVRSIDYIILFFLKYCTVNTMFADLFVWFVSLVCQARIAYIKYCFSVGF